MSWRVSARRQDTSAERQLTRAKGVVLVKTGDEDAAENHHGTEELSPEEDGKTSPEVERTEEAEGQLGARSVEFGAVDDARDPL